MEVMETVIRFKQGLGRLIRLENQPKNCRILVLDGRVQGIFGANYASDRILPQGKANLLRYA